MDEKQLIKELLTIPAGLHRIPGKVKTDFISRQRMRFNDWCTKTLNMAPKPVLRHSSPGYITVTKEGSKCDFMFTNGRDAHYRAFQSYRAYTICIRNGVYEFFMEAAISMHIQWHNCPMFKTWHKPEERERGYKRMLFIHERLNHLITK